MIALIDGRGKSVSQILEGLQRPSQLELPKENEIVSEIINNIKRYGQPALFNYVKQFDGVAFDDTNEMMVSDDEIDKAYSKISNEFISIIEKAKERIWNYHIKQKQNSWIDFEDESQIVMGQKIL